jgi:spermidine/putrescine transport system substrate-binding protein
MNYYYDPAVAAEVAAYVTYICPVKGAKEEILKNTDKEVAALADSQYIFPSDSDLKKAQVFFSLDPATETKYTQAFQKALGN